MNSIFQDVDIRSYMPSNVEYMVVEVKVTSFFKFECGVFRYSKGSISET